MNDINHPAVFQAISTLIDECVAGNRTAGATAMLVIKKMQENLLVEQHQFREVEGMDGLIECSICGGAEGSIPTCCPGRPLSADEHDAIHAGTLDFLRKNHGRDAAWWRRTPYTGAERITDPQPKEDEC